MRHALAFWIVFGSGALAGATGTLLWCAADPRRPLEWARRLSRALVGDDGRLQDRVDCPRRATTVRIVRPVFDQDGHGGGA